MIYGPPIGMKNSSFLGSWAPWYFQIRYILLNHLCIHLAPGHFSCFYRVDHIDQHFQMFLMISILFPHCFRTNNHFRVCFSLSHITHHLISNVFIIFSCSLSSGMKAPLSYKAHWKWTLSVLFVVGSLYPEHCLTFHNPSV